MTGPHIPVLLEEFLHYFEGKKLKIFFDGTVGAGGHAKALLDAHPEIELYLACDRDLHAQEIAKSTLEKYRNKIEWIHGNFAHLAHYLDERKISCVEGMFCDLGTSSMQLDQKDRGFSFRGDAPLDMRMDKREEMTAEKVVNELSEKELGQLFKEYGEEPRWRKAAHAIVESRRKKRIRTTEELVEVLSPILRFRKKGMHPATLIFQAIRIFVNREIESLKTFLKDAIQYLCPGGRLGIISFHSIEDRAVKWTFREESRWQILTKKPLQASYREKKMNPRSRSAKLRFAEKIPEVL